METHFSCRPACCKMTDVSINGFQYAILYPAYFIACVPLKSGLWSTAASHSIEFPRLLSIIEKFAVSGVCMDVSTARRTKGLQGILDMLSYQGFDADCFSVVALRVYVSAREWYSGDKRANMWKMSASVHDNFEYWPVLCNTRLPLWDRE